MSRKFSANAFTLAELLVVIAIIALLIAVAVPSFSAITTSTNRSLAENKLQLAAASASDLAARSPLGVDTVLAFFYDTDPLRAQRDRARLPGDPSDAQLAALSRNEQRVRAQVFIKAGSIPDRPESGPQERDGEDIVIDREVFIPAPEIAPVTLPTGWEIRGYVPGGWINEDGWYGGDNDFYSAPSVPREPHWVFPETSFFSRGEPGDTSDAPLTDADNGSRRQTFVLRFQGGTGRVVPSDSREILLYDPVISRRLRDGQQYLEDFSPYEFSDWGILVAAVESELNRALGVGAITNPKPIRGADYSLEQLRQVMGNQSADTVLARPVQQIVLYQLNDLLGALGARADRGTGTIYPSFLVDTSKIGDSYKLALPGATPLQQLRRLRNWIEVGQAEVNPAAPEPDPDVDEDETVLPTRVYALDLYTGRLREVNR